MTPDEIRVAVAADPALQAMAAAWDHQGIADALSAGRTRLVPTEVGKGALVEVLGLEVANPVLDIIDADPAFRHVTHLLVDGALRVDLPMVQQLLAGFVAGGILTAEQADAVTALARVDDPVPLPTVIAAIGVERREG